METAHRAKIGVGPDDRIVDVLTNQRAQASAKHRDPVTLLLVAVESELGLAGNRVIHQAHAIHARVRRPPAVERSGTFEPRRQQLIAIDPQRGNAALTKGLGCIIRCPTSRSHPVHAPNLIALELKALSALRL